MMSRQLGELVANFLERQPDPLREDDKGDPADHGARVSAVASIIALGLDEPLVLVEAQR